MINIQKLIIFLYINYNSLQHIIHFFSNSYQKYEMLIDLASKIYYLFLRDNFIGLVEGEIFLLPNGKITYTKMPDSSYFSHSLMQTQSKAQQKFY